MTKTTIFKGRDGWQAETIIPFEGERGEQGYRLKISTYKGTRSVPTYAGTERLDGAFVTTRIFRDFRGVVFKGVGLRCTEKTVREQHEKALTLIPDILKMEADWEAGQLAKAAADKLAA